MKPVVRTFSLPPERDGTNWRMLIAGAVLMVALIVYGIMEFGFAS